MSESKHFLCTACGKCCYGQLPLTYKDAIAFSGLFPIALVWTPVQKGSKDHRIVSQLGVKIPLFNGQELATLIVPTALIPPSFPCPALVDQKTCSIHRTKPSRCKTMPFYPYREERFQADLLLPRAGWECDVSSEAPLVFEGKEIVLREDFDQERHDLLEQVPILKRYAEYMFKYFDYLPKNLYAASSQKMGGNLLTSLSSFLTALRHPDTQQIAKQQLPVLNEYAAKTAHDPNLAVFHAQYSGWAKEMAYLSQAPVKAQASLT